MEIIWLTDCPYNNHIISHFNINYSYMGIIRMTVIVKPYMEIMWQMYP